MIKIDPSVLKETKWHEYVLRFVAGGIITVIAGLIAGKCGAGIGGLFLAFPASAILIEKHERQRKQRKGLHGEERGTDAAAIDAIGAAIGSVGLAAFAGIGWWLIPLYPDPSRSYWCRRHLVAGLIFHLDHSTAVPPVIMSCFREIALGRWAVERSCN